MFGGVGEIMKVLSGGPDAIRNILKGIGPEVISGLHKFFAGKVELQDGESGFIVAFAQHNEINIVMAIAIHDETRVCRIVSKYTLEDAIASIPDKDLNLGKLI